MPLVTPAEFFSPPPEPGNFGPGQVMGKDDFLKLLVTQLKSQDPLDPMDNTNFSAQLAQFSSLEQLQNINENLQASLDANMFLNASITNSLATSLVGKEVSAYGNTVTLTEGEAADLHFELDADATSVEVQVFDVSNRLVRTIDAGAVNAGRQTVSFDGKDDNGLDLPDGEYTFAIEATDGDGNVIGAMPYMVGITTAIRYVSGDVILLLGESEVSIAQVFEVRNAPAT